MRHIFPVSRCLRNALILLLLGLLPGTRVLAQININGMVRGAEAEALTGAYVYPGNDPGAVVTTDSTGRFALELAQPDTLLVTFLGYRTLRYYAAKTAENILLELTPTDASSITALTVRASKIPHGELASLRFNQMDVYRDPAAKADPLLAVNSLPAATNPDETANVSLRGSPSEATGIYLNDVPIRSAVRLDQSNGVGQFSLFGSLPLREVNVYASAPPVPFSQTSAGAVAIYTDPRTPTNTTTGLSLHVAGVGLSHARPLGERTGLRAYVNVGNVAAFRALNPSGLRELRKSQSLDGTLQLTHRIAEGKSLEFFYLGFDETFRYELTTPYFSGNFAQRKPRHLGIINYRQESGNWEVAINQALDWERGEFALGNLNNTTRRWHNHTALHGTHRSCGRTVRLGATLNAYDDLTTGRAPVLDYRLAPEDAAVAYRSAERHTLIEAYAAVSERLGSRWLASVGIKPIHQLEVGQLRLNAQASLRYRLAEGNHLHLSGGRFAQFLPPGPNIFAWQTLDLTQGALEYKGTDGNWRWTAAAFAKRELYSAAPDLNVLGAEARLDYEKGPWRTWVSWTGVRNRVVNTGEPTRRDFPFLARTRVHRELPGAMTAGLAATYRRGTTVRSLVDREEILGTDGWFAPIYAATGERLPNYARVDLAFTKMFILGAGTVVVYLNVNNLLGTENVQGYEYNAAFLERRAAVYSRRLVFFGGVWQL